MGSPLQPFAALAVARSWVATPAPWYNHEHRRTAIRFVTPAPRHAGLGTAPLAERCGLDEDAYAKHPLLRERQTRNGRRAVVYRNPENVNKQEGSDSEAQIEPPTEVKPQVRQFA